MLKWNVQNGARSALAAGAFLLAVSRSGAINGQSVEASADASVRQYCVLLRNGNVLLGSVQDSQDGYIVTRQGATVHVPRYRVQAICVDLSAAYEHQRAAISTTDAISHLQIAEWCIQQGLFSEAAEELETAGLLAPAHPRLATLQRRLAVARERDAAGQAERREDHAVRPTESLRNMSGAAPLSITPAPLESAEPLHLAMAELPKDSMEQFRRRIQPLLLNTCTTSGCHSIAEHGAFVLDRRALWGNATPTLSSENLAATLEHVDFKEPGESPLLWAATQAHTSGMKDPPIASESKSYALLQEWLLHISGRDTEDRNASEGLAAESGDVPHDPAYLADESEEVAISDEEVDALLYGKEQANIDRRIRRGLRPVPIPQSDPFDPKEFNDRYSPRAQKTQHR